MDGQYKILTERTELHAHYNPTCRAAARFEIRCVCLDLVYWKGYDTELRLAQRQQIFSKTERSLRSAVPFLSQWLRRIEAKSRLST